MFQLDAIMSIGADRLEKLVRAAVEFRPTIQKCMICKRDCPITGIYTGEANQRMCERCRRTYHHLAKIMCRKCGAFLGFMQSGINHDGYHVKPDETLHTEFCPLCDRERAKKEKACDLIEIRRFKQIRAGNEAAGIIESGAHRGEIG